MNGIKITHDQITPRLDELAPKLHSAIAALTEYYADRSVAHMKANAPWTDRTGNARNTLSTRAFTEPNRYVIVLYHVMPYGVWLEVRWSGRYAIILPTIEKMGPQVMTGLRKLLARI